MSNAFDLKEARFVAWNAWLKQIFGGKDPSPRSGVTGEALLEFLRESGGIANTDAGESDGSDSKDNSFVTQGSEEAENKGAGENKENKADVAGVIVVL